MTKKDSKEGRDLFQKIINIEIEDQMKDAYLAYAMSVIVGRALPVVRDRLKPVHRRILHAMNERAWRSDRPMSPAKIVGESSVTSTSRRRRGIRCHGPNGAGFSMRIPLIDGQELRIRRWRSSAAYRYRAPYHLAEELLRDIDKETVDFVANFDESRKEPTVLPPRIPPAGKRIVRDCRRHGDEHPPHNLAEVVDGTVALIDNPDITIRQLMKIIKGPDLPQRIIMGADSIAKRLLDGPRKRGGTRSCGN